MSLAAAPQVQEMLAQPHALPHESIPACLDWQMPKPFPAPRPAGCAMIEKERLFRFCLAAKQRVKTPRLAGLTHEEEDKEKH